MRLAQRFLDDLRRDWADIDSTPSPLGRQLERMRDGTVEVDFGVNFSFEQRRYKFALRTLIWDSLRPIERRILLAKVEPVKWDYCYREVDEKELVPDHRFSPPVLTTAAGEELALEREVQFPPAMGIRIVCSVKPVFLTNRQLAERFEVSERHLRMMVQQAYARIEEHPLMAALA